MMSLLMDIADGGGVIQILTLADRGGVKNGLNYADVILAWSLIEKNALEMLSMT